jgi:hypothetical protein
MARFDTARSRTIAVGAWLFATAVSWVLYAWLPPNPDQELFDYIGLVGSWGGKYYISSSDQNWPGAMLLHEAAVRLLGAHIWTFRVFDFALMAIGALALFSLLRSARLYLASWIVLPLYELMYITSGAWFAGQRDIVAAHFLFVAAAIFSYAIPVKKPQWLAIAGALIAFATLIRPTYLAYLAILCSLPALWVARGIIRRDDTAKQHILSMTYLLGGAILALASTILWGAISGNLKSWYEQAVMFNIYLSFHARNGSYIDTLISFAEVVKSWHWYLVFSTLGIVAWIVRDGVRIELLASIGVAITGVISALIQKVAFGYHLGAMLPVMALLTAIWLASVVEFSLSRPKNYLAAITAIGFCAVAVLGLAKKAVSFLPQAHAVLSGNYDEMLKTVKAGATPPFYSLEAANFILAHTRPDDPILVWSRSMHIAYLSERPFSTHFTDIGMLALLDEKFSLANDWFNQFDAEMTGNPPRFIVVQTPDSSDAFDKFYGPKTVNRAVQTVRDLVATKYVKAATFGPFEIFERNVTQRSSGLDLPVQFRVSDSRK